MIFTKRKFLKAVTVYLLVNLASELVFPTVAYALTSGPQQPEFTSFEPVATTNMVNEFNGDFTYNLPVVNIPGPNGGGYALSLSYHSGASSEEESSWVGFGWTLNPGAINRGNKGFPDDYAGDEISYTNRAPKNWTASFGVDQSIEYFSKDNELNLFGLTAGTTVRYNNYKGFSNVTSISVATYEGLASMSYTVSEDQHSFSAEVNPAAFFAVSKKKQIAKIKEAHKNKYAGEKATTDDIQKQHKRELTKDINKVKASIRSAKTLGGLASHYGLHAYADEFRPSNVQSYDGRSYNISFSLGVDPLPFHIGGSTGVQGSYSSQTQTAQTSYKAYGFLYQPLAEQVNTAERLMDYSVEKESHYNQRDRYLSIPYQSPDQFSVSGEGLSGSFKMHHSTMGHFSPREQESTTMIYNLGAELTVGMDIEPGTGMNLGVGDHRLKVRNWYDMGNTADYKFSNESADGVEKSFFRFNGDLGGNVEYTPGDKAYQASLRNIVPELGIRRYEPYINGSNVKTRLDKRSGRSSYIGFHTIDEMKESVSRTINGESREIQLRSFLKNNNKLSDDAWDMVNRSTGGIGSRIGEIATYNESGNRYVYGLPVFTAMEESKSLSVMDEKTPSPEVVNNFLVYKNVRPGTTQTEIGELKPKPYASSYLLTEITTPDYIDRSFDGPTSDDFGGWTRFDYRRGVNRFDVPYGSADKGNTQNWYKWRIPYNGLYYDKGEHSNFRDDMGSYSSGLKEIYYLKSIETKTHVAYFVTNKTNYTIPGTDILIRGSQSMRFDGLGAASNIGADGNKSAQDQIQQLEKLEKIVVYAKNDQGQAAGKPLKTVHLEYAYEAWKNLPNSMFYNADPGNTNMQSGKLTLKKVWFEYEGIVNSKITPYEFFYQYDLAGKVQSNHLKSKYSDDTHPEKDIIGYGETLDQTPDYNPASLDAWGNWGYQSDVYHNLMRPWLYQGKDRPGYDPAAWQLKIIRLPSGGEIHVQYEQHEYTHVQDKDALAMISLKGPGGTTSLLQTVFQNRYYLNLNDIDLDLNNDNQVDGTEKEAYVTKCSTYVASHEKIYFKFLYKLEGEEEPNRNNCDSEFITGYVHLTGVFSDPTGVYVEVQPTGGEGYTLPYQVCKDFITRNRGGLHPSANCGSYDGFQDDSPMEAIVKLIPKTGKDYKANDNHCKRISVNNSYFRLPLLKAKKGGGVRVKRVLMYDQGLEPGANGNEVLYGTEYIYKNLDGSSSGVATNEPSGMREENALVEYLAKRRDQKWITKVISGVDKEQFEGPIGEHLLPPPTVGYSRVVSKNIHSGKTGTGYKVTEYHTVKDSRYAFSVAKEETPIDESAFDYFYVPAIWVNVTIDNKWLSQGYRFIMNEMHGKMKRVATYGGDYVDGTEDKNYRSFEESYEYYEPGEKVPVMDEQGVVTKQYVGREAEVTMEMKSVEDIQNDGSIQVDFSTGIALFIPIFNISLFPSYTYKERKLRTHVINKVIHYPAIVKRVTTTQEGIVHLQEHKAFDKSTGMPVLTVDYDDYHGVLKGDNSRHNGAYSNYTIPAHFIYKSLGQKAVNQGYQKSYSQALQVTAIDAALGKYALILPDATAISSGFLTEGDLIRISDGSNKALFHIRSMTGTVLQLQAFSLTLPVSSCAGLEVVNSGYANQLAISAGSMLTYGTDYNTVNLPAHPLAIANGEKSLNSFTNVVSASVKTFSDDWNRDDVNADYHTAVADNVNDYETGRRGKWRPKSDYVFKTDISDGVTGANRIYSGAGILKNFKGYNYSNPSSLDNAKWLKGSMVTAYSPNGNILEEENILGVKSAARFSHQESVPGLVVQNGSYTSVLFRSFEDVDGAAAVTAHSGSRSWELAGSSSYTAGKIILDDQIKKAGLSSRFWLKTPDQFDLTSLQSEISNSSSMRRNGTIRQIARVGEWTLIEARFNDFSSYADLASLAVTIKNNSGGKIWLDDIRVQPLDAAMGCYVYDLKNLRLLATFDDQHFGMYYQYNAEGQLVRKMVETERGMKTIAETQYNTATR